MNAYDQAQASGQHWSAPQQAGFLLAQLVRESSLPVLSGCPPKKQEHLILQDFEHKMPEFAVEREAAVVELKKSFVFPGDSSVSAFLFQHRTLSPLLLDSVPELKRLFGRGTVFQLRAPLDGLGSQTLYAVVIWPGAAAEVRTALGRFDEGWWLPRSHRAAGYLTFTYELV
jgi:hypothetical protein